MIQGFVDGDKLVIDKVNRRALQSALVIVLLLALIVLMLWLLWSVVSWGLFGS